MSEMLRIEGYPRPGQPKAFLRWARHGQEAGVVVKTKLFWQRRFQQLVKLVRH